PKMRWNLILPVLEHALLWDSIEGVIDLDSRQTCRVIRQHLFRRQVFRIETSLPLFVTKAAGSDLEVHRRRSKLPRLFYDDGSDVILSNQRGHYLVLAHDC